MKGSQRGVVVSVLAWFAGAAAAIAVGLLALSNIGGGSIPDALHPLPSDGDIQYVPARPGAATSATRSATRSASPTPRPSRSQAGAEPSTGNSTPTETSPGAPPETSQGVISTSAGSVVVECNPSQAYLVSWSPEPGYHAEKVRRGPAQVVQVKFQSDSDKLVLNAKCVDGVPQQVGGGNG